MKRKETADDRAVKDAAKVQRNMETVGPLEMEDPEGHAQKKQLQKKVSGKPANARKKAARENRAKTEKAVDAVVNMRRNGGAQR